MIYLRNTHHSRPCLVPVGNGSARLLLPAVTSSMPAEVVELPSVKRLLRAQVLAIVGPAGWHAGARQAWARHCDMAALVLAAEQHEIDRLRQAAPRPQLRKPPSPSRKRRADEWPPQWTERLRARWAAGDAPATIAAELGVTVRAVLAKAKREGLPARPRADGWPAARRARLKVHWAAGASPGEIASELGVSYGAVASQAKRLGLPARARKLGA